MLVLKIKIREHVPTTQHAGQPLVGFQVMKRLFTTKKNTGCSGVFGEKEIQGQNLWTPWAERQRWCKAFGAGTVSRLPPSPTFYSRLCHARLEVAQVFSVSITTSSNAFQGTAEPRHPRTWLALFCVLYEIPTTCFLRSAEF